MKHFKWFRAFRFKKRKPRIDFSLGMDEITKSKLKLDLAGSKENLPGQNQVWSLP